MILGLLESLTDKNPDVQTSVSDSLCILGSKKSFVVLKISYEYLTNPNTKVNLLFKIIKYLL